MQESRNDSKDAIMKETDDNTYIAVYVNKIKI